MVVYAKFEDPRDQPLEACMWQADGDLVEGFTEPASASASAPRLSKPVNAGTTFKYSFTYALFAYDTDRRDYKSLRMDAVRDVPLSGDQKIVKINISDFERMYSPMRLILTDTTSYLPEQPKLSLSLVLNESKRDQTLGREQRIPAVFAVKHTAVPQNRQIDMPLPSLVSLTIEFNLNDML